MGRLAEALFQKVADHRRARAAADEDDLVDHLGRDLRLVEGGLDAVERLHDERADETLELFPADLHVEVQRVAVLLGDELLLEPGVGVGRQRLLGVLGRAQDARLRNERGAKIDAVFLAEAVGDEVHEQVVEVVAAELRVAVAGQHLDDALLGLDDGHVEGATAEVVDEHPLEFFVVGVVGQRGGGRLVEDADDFQPREFARLARRLALVVLEVGGDGDDGLPDRHAEFGGGAVAQLAQDHRRDFLRPILLIAEADFHVLAHFAFDRLDRPLRGCRPLVAGRPADE